MKPLPPLDPADLDQVFAATAELWPELRGKRLFVTGGTGFFGSWLLEAFARANKKLDLGASVTVLTRNPDAFALKCPHLTADTAVRLHRGDVRSFEFPPGEFPHIIHAAAESGVRPNAALPPVVFDTIVQGTRRVLDFATVCRARGLLFISSGAVYGRQPPELTHTPENYLGAPDTMNPDSAYGEAKRAAELLCRLHSEEHNLEVKVARCFSFVGPHVPLDFAVGCFIRDGLNGGPIQVTGDGSPCRSYLYAADLAVWLWTILLRGRPSHPYNVGSETAISVVDLARTVARLLGPDVGVEVAIAPVPGRTAERYVPSTRLARTELGLKQGIDLEESVRRTIAWCSQPNANSHCAPEHS